VILIIEGSDLVGKSTLAESIRDHRGWPIVKIRWALTGDVESETTGMARATIELLLGLNPDIVLDRSYFSMWAYSEDPSFMPPLMQRFDRVSSQHQARLVVLTASESEIRRRWRAQPDEYFSLQVILRANERFRSLAQHVPTSLPVLELDTSVLTPDEIAAEVERFLDAGQSGSSIER
jgi:hypothetical protein